MSADVDARLDLLNVMRGRGFGSPDITLTDTGHDFVVSLDGMQRLLERRDGEGHDVPELPVLHGPDLDAAIDAAPAPPDLGICETALHARTRTHVDSQVEDYRSEQEREKCRRDLMAAGKAFDDETVETLQLRSIIGGSFTYGIAVGVEVEKIKARRRT